jgi:hypothetical protein
MCWRWLVGLALAGGAAVAAADYPCAVVPAELLHPASHVFGADGAPDGIRISGAGTTLGVLIPQTSDRYRLALIRGGELVGEIDLPSPEHGFPRTPWFTLGDDGDLALLSVRDLIAVYGGDELEAVVRPEQEVTGAVASRGELLWSALPDEAAIVSRLVREGGSELIERYVKGEAWSEVRQLLRDAPAPLLLRSDLDGSDQEVLLDFDGSEPCEGCMAMSHMLYPAVRSDGKIWAVGRFTGRVRLLSASGAVKSDFVLPEGLSLEADDQEIQQERQQELEANPPPGHEDRGRNALKDPESDDSFSIMVTGPGPRVRSVLARDRDLVVVPLATDPPPGSILVFEDGAEVPVCFQLPEALVGKPLAHQYAATDDALWLRKPFGYVSWSDLQALLEPDDGADRNETRR